MSEVIKRKKREQRYQISVDKFKAWFKEEPWLGMIVKSAKGKFFVIEDINRLKKNVLIARELKWYEMTGLKKKL